MPCDRLCTFQADSLFFQQLQANQTDWHPDTVIHGDLKWDNLLVTDDVGAEIKFVDWELATMGDAAFDVAGVLQSYMVYGIDQVCSPILGDIANPQLDAETFWSSYLQHAGLDGDDRFAHRVKRLCAARLIQTALEREFLSASLSAVAWELIAMSRIILCQRQESATNPWAIRMDPER